VTAFLGRARYERTPDAAGSRNGSRPRRVQTAEGEISIAVPQVRGSLERFVSSVIPDTRAIVRTRPLEALVIGAHVRGLSDRDIESLAREAGLGTISRTTVSTICRELRDRYRAFRARSLADIRILALFTDAIYLPVRPRVPRRACSWRMASRPRASGCCSMSAWVSASGPRTGWTSVVASSAGVSGARSSS